MTEGTAPRILNLGTR